MNRPAAGGAISVSVPEVKGASNKRNNLAPMARIEHAIVGQTACDIIAAQLPAEYRLIVKSVTSDAFAGLPEPPAHLAGGATGHALRPLSSAQQTSAVLDASQFVGVVKRIAAERNCGVLSDAFLEKCINLYQAASNSNGTLVYK